MVDCRRCGKKISEKTKSVYNFLCKKCEKILARKIASGKIPIIGGKKRRYSPKQMLEALRFEIATDLTEGRYSKRLRDWK